MEILLARHGVTDWNRAQRLQGREDIPLNAEGIAQATALGDALRGMEFKYLLSSPLGRAQVTAEIIAGSIGGMAVTVEPDLTERDYGELSGRVATGLGRSIFEPDESASGLEPLELVTGRILGVLRKYAHGGAGRLLAVTHGGAINAVLREITGGEYGSGKTRLHNGGVCVLGYDGERFSLLRHDLLPDEITAG